MAFFGKKKRNRNAPDSWSAPDPTEMLRQAAVEAGATAGQDWSHIDNAERAETAVAAGQLIFILLVAEEFGGEPHPVNMVPVPPGFDEVKRLIDGTILRFAQDGHVDKLDARPEYEGNSMVPKRIAISCSHSDPAKTGTFNQTIEIW